MATKRDPATKKREKTGGRIKGTPNKTTTITKTVIASLLDTYNSSGMMSNDFAALEPKDRLLIAEKLMNYVMPKMQSQQIDLQADSAHVTIDSRLRQLADEGVD